MIQHPQQHPEFVDGWIDAESAMPPNDTTVLIKLNSPNYATKEAFILDDEAKIKYWMQICRVGWLPIHGTSSPCGAITNGMLQVSAYSPPESMSVRVNAEGTVGRVDMLAARKNDDWVSGDFIRGYVHTPLKPTDLWKYIF